MAGLDPAIHAAGRQPTSGLRQFGQSSDPGSAQSQTPATPPSHPVDGRVKPGHDDLERDRHMRFPCRGAEGLSVGGQTINAQPTWGTTMKHLLLGAALSALLAAPASAACKVTIGVVMSLTGPAGAYGQAGAKSVEMALRDINEAGGVLGCTLATDTRDAQSQGTVAVDAAKQLVEIEHVPAIIGGIISSVSIPILTAVTAPAKVGRTRPHPRRRRSRRSDAREKPTASSSARSRRMRCRASPPRNTRSISASRSSRSSR